MRRISFATLLSLACAALAGCAAAVDPVAIRDAQLGVQVKTALVNDPRLGTQAIEVRVARGVVRLSGRVESDADAQRAVGLARAVPGVVDVQADLRASPAAGRPEPAVGPGARNPGPAPGRVGPLDDTASRTPPLVAVGLLVGRTVPSSAGLGSGVRIGPLVRIGSGSGLGMTIGFGWFRADWRSADGSTRGQVKIRPLMGGVAYDLRTDRASLSFSLVGGVAVNGLTQSGAPAAREHLLSVGNSPAVRPGVSLWIDIGRRLALNVSGGYLVTRPRVTMLEAGEVRSRVLRADTVQVNTGIAYSLF